VLERSTSHCVGLVQPIIVVPAVTLVPDKTKFKPNAPGPPEIVPPAQNVVPVIAHADAVTELAEHVPPPHVHAEKQQANAPAQ
jgi:hypothetical protein